VDRRPDTGGSRYGSRDLHRKAVGLTSLHHESEFPPPLKLRRTRRSLGVGGPGAGPRCDACCRPRDARSATSLGPRRLLARSGVTCRPPPHGFALQGRQPKASRESWHARCHSRVVEAVAPIVTNSLASRRSHGLRRT
jgi:hypothetical protein